MSWTEFFIKNWKTIVLCFFLAVFAGCRLVWERNIKEKFLNPRWYKRKIFK